MTSETAATARRPELLVRIEHAARRVAQLDVERAAEKERRDRLMVEAIKAGHTYREVAGAARDGDGTSTVSVVYNAMTDYA